MNQKSVILVKTEFLRSYLNDRKLSERQFAELIGVAHSTVNRILNGKRNPGGKFVSGVLQNFSDLSFDQVFSYRRILPKSDKVYIEKTS
ncbi:helix-turn-helix transcriptional regulator [Peribacillus frigoritolerans]|uniref:helix-turn-helix transcriptional regulator n=1 Tax=Peribacillus frigoritolerans TaxID=450367 RepID=UPI003D28346F